MSGSRGKPKPKLRDLSQQPLTYDEQDALLEAVVTKMPPVAVAILGAILVEHELETSLRKKLPRKDDKTWLDMLDETGPFSTFSRKIMAGHALRIYDKKIQTNLDIVRTIRNAFAHSKRVIDFNHPLVMAQLRRVAVPTLNQKRYRDIRKNTDGLDAYRSLCLQLATWLIKRRMRTLTSHRKRKPRKYSSFFDALVPSLKLANLGQPPEDGQLSPLQLYSLSQSGDPTPPTQGGYVAGLPGLFGLGDALRRRTDKKK
jgi:hypothetical protein